MAEDMGKALLKQRQVEEDRKRYEKVGCLLQAAGGDGLASALIACEGLVNPQQHMAELNTECEEKRKYMDVLNSRTADALKVLCSALLQFVEDEPDPFVVERDVGNAIYILEGKNDGLIQENKDGEDSHIAWEGQRISLNSVWEDHGAQVTVTGLLGGFDNSRVTITYMASGDSVPLHPRDLLARFREVVEDTEEPTHEVLPGGGVRHQGWHIRVGGVWRGQVDGRLVEITGINVSSGSVAITRGKKGVGNITFDDLVKYYSLQS